MTIRRRSVYDADQEALRDSVARFLASGVAESPEFLGIASEYGFVGLGAPEVEDPRFAAVVLEEAMTAGLPHVALELAMHDGYALPLLGKCGDAGLAAVAEGAIRAELVSSGWVLRGRAGNVVNGLGAATLAVVAQTDDGVELVFAVPADTAGLTRLPADEVLGLDGLDLADVTLDGVAVAAPVKTNLDAARCRHQLALAVAAVAGARTALRTTVEYVQQRKAFGTPIATFENTRHALGTLGARIAAVESYVDSCLAAAASGEQLGPGTAAAAKLTATELLGEAVDQGVQLHGGYGYMWEYPIARAYAAARFFRLHGVAGERLDRELAGAVGV